MNKRLFTLFTLSIIGFTCIGETNCMKRQREGEKSHQDRQKKRKKEEERTPQKNGNLQPIQPWAPKPFKKSYIYGRTLRMDIEQEKENAPITHTSKPMRGIITSSTATSENVTSISTNGAREPLLANSMKIRENGTTIYTTSNSLSGDALRAAALNAHTQTLLDQVQLQQRAQLPNTNQEGFND